MFKRKISFAIMLTIALTAIIIDNANAQPYLKDAFKDYFYMGVALNEWHVTGKNKASADLAAKQFNSITPENSMKWGPINPEPDKFNFAPADSFVAFGERNNMFIIGHCLVWHSQTPGWVFKDEAGNPVSREVLLQRMKDHIFAVAGRYKGRVKGWDVVNEAINEDGTFRQSPWLKIIGEDFIEKAFQFAHEADPDAELYYNDYNEWYKGKRETIVAMVNKFKAKGIRIDGIGMQGHWGVDSPSIAQLDSTMSDYAGTGAKIMVTELDLDVLPNPYNYTGADVSKRFALTPESNPYKDGLPDSMVAVQTKMFVDYFKLFEKYKDSISRITFWGVHDGESWKNNFPIRGRTNYPLLFDRNLKPKPAVEAIINTVKK